MWIVSKEGLIVLGVLAALAVLGVVLLLVPPRDAAPSSPTPVAATTTAPVPPTPPVPPAAPALPPAVPPQAPTPATVSATPTPVAAAPVPPAPPSSSGAVGPSTAVDGIIYAGEYSHNTRAAGFEIHWSNDAHTLRVGLISPGLGYLAIGFDPVNRMEGANYILGAVVDGRVTVRDDFGIGPVAHAPDAAIGGTNDVLEAAGCEVGGKTYLEFVIPLDSGDAKDKALIPGSTYKVLIAYHETSDEFGAWHSRRGSGSITLDPAP